MIKYAITRFIALYILVSLLLALIRYFIDVPAGVSTIILFLAPYSAGMLWYGKYEIIPETGFSWKCAGWFAFIGLLISGAFGALALQAPEVQAMVNEVGYGFFWGILLVITILQFFVARWAFPSGIKQAAKAKAVQDAKNNED